MRYRTCWPNSSPPPPTAVGCGSSWTAPAALPSTFADALVEPLARLGTRAVRVHAADFLRPASLRFEYGREDVDAYYDRWVDRAAIEREVLRPFGHSGRWLPALWDTAADRSARADYLTTAPPAVLVLDGSMLLGRGLGIDLAVHLHLGDAALRRRTADEERWTLPAFGRYAVDVSPLAVADVVVRVDDPRHPAIAVGGGHAG